MNIKHPFSKHLISENAKVIDALPMLDQLGADAILFVVKDNTVLLGSLTDGDVRRGLIKGNSIEQKVTDFIQDNPKCIVKNEYNLSDIIEYRKNNFKIIPVIDEQKRIVNVINFRLIKSYLPVDAIVMAGGRGERLRPLTDTIPKPLLKVGDKPIIEHNLNRLISYGVDDFWITLKYLGSQVKEYFKNGEEQGVHIHYIEETEPLGTVGAAKQAVGLKHDTVLLTNSDLLTNIDYEDFYLHFINSNADFSVVTIPYNVTIPYAVLETQNEEVINFKEKPTYTYFSNGGIYLMKKEVLEMIPANQFFNTTDLMERLISQGKKVVSYPHRGYWLDIGKHEEYQKAQEDIKHIKF
jgi:dTDP-glucose pyrophosphorylase